MSDGQWRVLAILLATLGIEIVTSENTRKFLLDVLAGRNPGNDIAGAPAAALGFSLGAIALLGVAAVNDGLATGIAVLFLVLVLINRGDVIGPALQQATNTLMGLSGKNPQSGTQGK